MRVVAARKVGVRRTYDLEVDHPSHQFYLANGKLTSNSHAVSYALDSYMCAHLITHYEPEWLCAYAEIESGGAKRERALAEIKSFGYDFVKLDINYASDTWTILEGKKFMPSFGTCKGVGSAAIDEIMANRPYRTVYDLLWDHNSKWRHSKFNKRVLSNLIRVGAFQSMNIVGEDAYFDHYRHMHETIIENWATLRKPKSGPETLDRLAAETRGIDDWSKMEKIISHIELIGELDTDMVIPPQLRERLSERGVTSIDDLSEGDEKIVWFIVLEMKELKTKRGKPYLRLKCQGELGVHNVRVWNWYPGSDAITECSGYLAQVRHDNYGLSTSARKMREIEE